MSGRIPQSFIDDLLARTDIVGVIESRVPMKRAGRNWSACCPFHKEKTPSFTVSPDKQFYYCFGCGATGNAIGFLMDYERRSFPEAVEELAGRAGLAVPHENDGDDAHASRLRALYEALDAAARDYQEQLRRHAARARAVDYLRGRGLTGEIARRFGLGYAPPGWDHLLAAMGKDEATCQQLIEVGLLVRQDGKTYDRFRDRVMFPIRDLRGRAIGFGGRVIGDGKPKYLNSPETPVFHKGRELYGLYEAKQANKAPDRLIVVEGYMDVIALAQQGITNAVATLGTACTGDHVDLLFRHANEVVFCFDGDAAGRRAAWRALESSLPKLQDGRSARVLFLPPEHDPDSLVRAEGPAAFNARLAQAESVDDVLFRELASRVDLARTDGRARLASLARPYLAQVPGEILRELMTNKLAALAEVDPRLLAATPSAPVPATSAEPEPPVFTDDFPPPDEPPAGNGRFSRGRRWQPSPPRTARAPSLSAAGHVVRRLLLAPELARQVELLPELRGLDMPDVPLLCEILDILHDSEHPSVATLFGRLRGTEHEDALAALAGREFIHGTGEDDAARNLLLDEINGGLRQLELAWWDTEISLEQQRDGGPDAARLWELIQRRQAIKDGLGGR